MDDTNIIPQQDAQPYAVGNDVNPLAQPASTIPAFQPAPQENLSSQLYNVAGAGEIQGSQVSTPIITPTSQNVPNGVQQDPLPVDAILQPVVASDEKIYAMAAYIPFLSFVSLILKPESAFVRLHARQSLFLTLIFLVMLVALGVFSVFGIIGTLLAILIGFLQVGLMVLAVYSMYMALTGIWWKIPILGEISSFIPIELFAKFSKEMIKDQVVQAKSDYDSRQNANKP